MISKEEVEQLVNQVIEKVLKRHKQAEQNKIIKTSRVPTPHSLIERAWKAREACDNAFQNNLHKKMYKDKDRSK